MFLDGKPSDHRKNEGNAGTVNGTEGCEGKERKEEGTSEERAQNEHVADRGHLKRNPTVVCTVRDSSVACYRESTENNPPADQCQQFRLLPQWRLVVNRYVRCVHNS